MLEITTESGAVYLYDVEGHRILRATGPMNPRMLLPNEQWLDLQEDAEPEIEVGQRIHFSLADDIYRVTTPVVSIEEV